MLDNGYHGVIPITAGGYPTAFFRSENHFSKRSNPFKVFANVLHLTLQVKAMTSFDLCAAHLSLDSRWMWSMGRRASELQAAITEVVHSNMHARFP